MANVKVPALLHKMSKAAQKAWYKKNNMTMPSEVEGGGRSAAAAKRVVAPAPRKQMAAAPQSVRAMNTARQQAYYAKGGRQPIGAGGSGGHSSMAGVGQSSAKEIIKGIKAGYNPKVALVRYTNEEVEQVDEVTKKEAEETLGGPVKTKPKMPPGKQPEGYRYVRALARRAMKAGLKKEEVEQVAEIDYKKYLKVSQEKRPFTIRTVDAALKTDKAGDPNPLRKLGNTNKARKFAQKQLTKKFNASQPARPFPVYEPGRTYVGDSVEHDGPVIDEARRMSAAEKLGRAFDREKTASDASRKRGEEMLAQARAEYAKKQAAKTNEEVELDEAQKKLKPSYWRAEWRLGTQTEVDKNNKKIYDKLAKTDPVKAKAFHDNLSKMRKEEVEQPQTQREGFLDFMKRKKPEVKKPAFSHAHARAFFKKLDKQTRITSMRPNAQRVRTVYAEETHLDERIDVNKQKKNAVMRQAGVNAAISGKVPFAGSALQMGRKAAKKLPSKTLAKSYRELPRVAEEAIEEGKADTSLAAKAKKSGVSLGTLRKVYNRGVAAWNSGHRPGTTPQQWGHARVNSYITKGKTYHTADKDLRRESVDFNEAFKEEFNDEIE
jgi:ribosomal protein S13